MSDHPVRGSLAASSWHLSSAVGFPETPQLNLCVHQSHVYIFQSAKFLETVGSKIAESEWSSKEIWSWLIDCLLQDLTTQRVEYWKSLPTWSTVVEHLPGAHRARLISLQQHVGAHAPALPPRSEEESKKSCALELPHLCLISLLIFTMPWKYHTKKEPSYLYKIVCKILNSRMRSHPILLCPCPGLPVACLLVTQEGAAPCQMTFLTTTVIVSVTVVT